MPGPKGSGILLLGPPHRLITTAKCFRMELTDQLGIGHLSLIMKIIVLFLISLPGFARAIVTGDCPQTIKVSYQALQPLRNEELPSESRYATLERIVAERDLLEKALASTYQNLVFTRVDTRYNQCRYLTSDFTASKIPGANETRLVTVEGRDMIRVSLRIGDSYFWIEHNLRKYSVEGVTLASHAKAKIIGVFAYLSPVTPVGWAEGPKIY